jgi:hypothetical protein
MSLWPGVGHSKANVILTRTSMSDDLLWGLVWAAVTAMIVRLGWAAATRLFPGDGYIDLVQHTIVIVIAQITVATIIIGGLGYLSPGSLLEAGTIVAVVTRVAVGRLHLPTTRTRDECDRGWLAIWLLVFAGCAGYTVIRGLLCFPADWDTLMYHLPLVDHWLQAGSLYAPDALRWSMPGNNEIVILWMVAPFSGDFLSVLGNIPAVILLACSARALGGLTGASVTWRNLGALAVVTNSVVSNQLVDAENDVAVAAMFLAGLTYGLRYASEGRLGDLLLGAVSLGLLGGGEILRSWLPRRRSRCVGRGDSCTEEWAGGTRGDSRWNHWNLGSRRVLVCPELGPRRGAPSPAWGNRRRTRPRQPVP